MGRTCVLVLQLPVGWMSHGLDYRQTVEFSEVASLEALHVEQCVALERLCVYDRLCSLTRL